MSPRLKLSIVGLGFLALGLLLGAGLPVDRFLKEPQLSSGAVIDYAQPASKPSLMFDFGDGRVRTFEDLEVTADQTLLNLTQSVTANQGWSFVFDPPGQWGVFIREIDGVANGSGDRFWQYWVNNEQIQMAADRYVVKPGDVIEWQFVKLQSNS